MRRPALLSCLSLLLALPCVAAPARDAGDPLPPAVKQALTTARLPQGSYAFVVAPVDGGEPILAVNAGAPMNPASVMKLVTTYAALELLGPSHVWSTQFLAAKPVVDGVLDGPLYLRGNGDPKLTMEVFASMLRELRLRGVREIRGDLLLDRQAFRLPPHDPAAFDNEPLRPYNAGADPLLINFLSLRFLLVPDAERKKVAVLQETPDPRIDLVNRLILADHEKAECGDWRDRLTIKAEGLRIEFAGRYPLRCGEKSLGLAPLSPNVQIDGLFRALWAELGGTWTGKARDGETPTDAQPLVRRDSAALGELVRDINKFSNNVMARQAFLALAERRPATYEGARERVREWLRSKGIADHGLSIENGSGLSRSDRMSAEQLAKLLAAAWQSPVMPELMASLPILGEDGTLRKRGNGTGRGRAHLKTGYIEGARALAGYILDQKGRRWVFVGMVNHAHAAKGKEAIDLLVDWVISRPDEAAGITNGQ